MNEKEVTEYNFPFALQKKIKKERERANRFLAVVSVQAGERGCVLGKWMMSFCSQALWLTVGWR